MVNKSAKEIFENPPDSELLVYLEPGEGEVPLRLGGVPQPGTVNPFLVVRRHTEQ